MNLKQLRYFLAVAQEKQITAAAKRLYIAQPPLSYQLKQLEKELGVKLFVRTSHGIELTDAGKELESYAQRIVDLATIAKEKVQKTSQGEYGTIKIGSVSSSVGELPQEKFQLLTKYYPRISFEIYEENTYGILEKLHDEIVDVAIVRTPYDKKGLNFKTITNDKMMAVTTDEGLLKRKKVTLKELAEQPLIIYRRFENIFNESFAHQGIKPFYAVKCDDSRTAILWAKNKMGIALVPESIAKLYAKNQYLPVDHLNWETHLQLVWRKGQVSPVVQKVIDLF